MRSDKSEKITKDDELRILTFFHTEEDNRDQVIANKLKLNVNQVSDFLNNHFKRKQKRIFERKFNDIDWGEL